MFCTFGVFWTLPTAWLSGTAAAGAIALINSIGNLAGFGGPYLIGWVKEATGSTSTGLLVLALLPLIGGLLVFLGGHETKAEFAGGAGEVAESASHVVPDSERSERDPDPYAMLSRRQLHASVATGPAPGGLCPADRTTELPTLTKS